MAPGPPIAMAMATPAMFPNPMVPDATENANIRSYVDGTDLSLLGFRNCIKTYDIKQDIGETDTNINLTTATWNSNLSKNII